MAGPPEVQASDLARSELPFLLVSGLSPHAVGTLRDLFALPDHERALIFKELSEDVKQAGPSSKTVRDNEARIHAVEIYNQVAEHLTLDNDVAKREMTMREFDAAPRKIREGSRAKRLAAIYLGSWSLLQQAATGERTEPNPTQVKRRKRVIKQQARYSRIQTGLDDWFSTGPEETTKAAYNAWRVKRNKNLNEGELPFVGADQIVKRLGKPWAEIVVDLEAGTLVIPVISGGETQAAEEQADIEGAPGDLELAREARPLDPRKYKFDGDLVARRLRQGLLAHKWKPADLASKTGLSTSTVDGLTYGNTSDGVQFSTLIALARGLKVPVEWFLTPDEKTGVPRRRKRPVKNKKSQGLKPP